MAPLQRQLRVMLPAMAILGIAVIVSWFVLIAAPAEEVAVSTPQPSVTVAPAPTVRPTQRATPVNTATPRLRETPSPPWHGSPILEKRFTALILGTDMTAGRAARGDALQTDAILVATASSDQGSVAIISIPRDMVDIPLDEGAIWRRKINSIYQAQGPEVLRTAVEKLLGLQIDRYVAMDMDQFRSVVAAVGGVDVDVEHEIRDSTIGFRLSAGPQRLNADDALRYARHRAQGGDYARAERHQRILLGFVDRAGESPDEVRLEELYRTFAAIDTDVTVHDLPALVELVRRVVGAERETVVLKAPEFALFEGIQGARGWILVPDLEAIRAEVSRLTE